MTITDRTRRMAVAALLTVAFVAGCSSTSPRHLATTVTSTSTVPSTTTSTPTTVPLECPARGPSHVAQHQQPGTAATFVPGHPSELLGCRYRGDNQPQPIGSMATSARFPADAIAAELNAARPVPKVINLMCPIDFGEMILLIFGYPNGSQLTVSIARGGCAFASNGERRIFTPPATLTRLETVLGHDNL